MKRLVVTLMVVAGICAIAYSVFTSPDIARVKKLGAQVGRLRQQNQALARKNADLRRQIVALRNDPRLAERRAREAGGLAKPGEVIFQFRKPHKTVAMLVKLTVSADSMTLAGDDVSIDKLKGALAKLHKEVPGARLKVVFDKVGPLRRQRVVDIVHASALTHAVFHDAHEAGHEKK